MSSFLESKRRQEEVAAAAARRSTPRRLHLLSSPGGFQNQMVPEAILRSLFSLLLSIVAGIETLFAIAGGGLGFFG